MFDYMLDGINSLEYNTRECFNLYLYLSLYKNENAYVHLDMLPVCNKVWFLVSMFLFFLGSEFCTE